MTTIETMSCNQLINKENMFTDNPGFNQFNLKNYYSKIDIDKLLQGYAVKGGLDTECDIDIIYPKIKKTQTVLEVGAGYGRVIHALLKRGYQGKISSIEYSPYLYKLLKRTFPNDVDIYEDNILTFDTNKTFSAILYLWSGISDFNKKTQPNVFEKLSYLLEKDGILILDISIDSIKPLNAFLSKKNFYYIHKETYSALGYIPSKDEMFSYAKQTNLQLLTYKRYSTTTSRKRDLYYFIKN